LCQKIATSVRRRGALPRCLQEIDQFLEVDPHRRYPESCSVGPMLGFKRFFNARRVVAGVELVQKIVKGQFDGSMFDVPASFGTDPFCIWYNMLAA
jgi:hypothetical protein